MSRIRRFLIRDFKFKIIILFFFNKSYIKFDKDSMGYQMRDNKKMLGLYCLFAKAILRIFNEFIFLFNF